MRKHFIIFGTMFLMTLAFVQPSAATNGDNLIGVGPISRSMGGVGVAAPQDSISAIFANPAAMCFGAFCPGSEATFSGTYFNPTVEGKIVAPNPSTGQPMQASEKSNMKSFVVPAIGITAPLSPKLRFGVGAYGVSGMGVNYKEEDPMFQNTYTKFEVMKFAPNLAYLVTPDFSIGASVSVAYQNLDLGAGGEHDYAYGAQIGALYHFGLFNFGASYTTPQKVTHENVFDFNGDGNYDDLDLEAPQTIALGISMEPTSSLLVEFDTKWYNWSDAEGYKDFDWEDQWVFALGAQYKVTPALSLRIGYNYGKSPVKEHNGWNPAPPTMDPNNTVNVQGTNVNTANYEAFRIIGFPAIIEQHLTLGAGYDFSNNMSINFSYMHGFEKTISETSADDMVKLESSLKEDSVSMGLTVRF
jgi:long-chain fatty acid transport protein